MEVNAIISALMSILTPFVDAIEFFFDLFIREDLKIFGLAYYKWVIGFFIILLVFNYIRGIADD